MAHVKFIAKGKVDGQEYNKGNTLDVGEATKSRLLKEGCIENSNGSDCSQLQEALDQANEDKKALEDQVKDLVANEDEILRDFHAASKIAEYERLKVKYSLIEE